MGLRHQSQAHSLEAPGIEPGSRSTSMSASTCVARPFPRSVRRLPRVCWTGLRQAGSRDNYRPDFFSGNGRRIGLGCPIPRVPTSPTCVRTGPFRAKLPGRPTGITPREKTAVQQLSFDRLFTWPADQPRHATWHFNLPGRNQFAPRAEKHQRPTVSFYVQTHFKQGRPTWTYGPS